MRLRPLLGVRAAVQFDRAGLVEVHVSGDLVVGPGCGHPISENASESFLPFDRDDRGPLLQALARPPAEARLDLVRALHVGLVPGLAVAGRGVVVVGVGQRQVGRGRAGVAVPLPPLPVVVRGVDVTGLHGQREAASGRGDVLRVHEPRRGSRVDVGAPNVHRPGGQPAGHGVVNGLRGRGLRRLDDRAPVCPAGRLQRDVAAVAPAAAQVAAGGVNRVIPAL